MKKLIISLSIFALSCGAEQSRYVCNCEQQKALQSFVANGIRAGNNMSDEEMEDVIYQLRIDGTKMFCKLKPVWIDSQGGIDWRKHKLDTCEIIMDLN